MALLREAPAWLLGNALRETHLALVRWRRRLRYRREGLEAVPDPTAIVEVDPASITHVVPLSRFDETLPRLLMGAVRGGDWDLDVPPVEERPKFRACRARVEEDVPWEDTGIVDHLAAELEAADAETIEHGCGSRAELLERYETERETLYRSLRESGYDRSRSPVCCRVHVGRDGRLLLGSGGRHRFYLSRLLGVESVPVQVLCRHWDWQAVREAVATADSPDDLSAELRDFLDHPDLQEFPLARDRAPQLRA